MLSVNDALCGWSPMGGNDEDVNVSQDMCFININPFHVQSNAFLSPVCPPLNTTSKPCSLQSHALPSVSLTGVVHTSMPPSSDRRAQRNRNRDPSWIPRPRNAFIIFRCEYSREHSQSSQELQSDDDSTNATVKTLSKRAADAWKQLPASERERYKVLADREREEHARLYPHYRFRPVKRQASVARKSSRERSLGPRISSGECPAVASIPFPSVLARAPEKPPAEVATLQVGGLSLPVPTPSPLDSQAESPLLVPLSLDPLLSCSLSEASFSSGPSPSPAPAEPCAPLCRSAVSLPTDAFRCDNAISRMDLGQGDTEQAQTLETYAVGLYNYDVFSPFSFPEYY